MKHISLTEKTALARELVKSLVVSASILTYTIQVLLLASIWKAKIYVNINRLSILTSPNLVPLNNLSLFSVILLHLLTLSITLRFCEYTTRHIRLCMIRLTSKLFIGLVVLVTSTILIALAYGIYSTITLLLLLTSTLLAFIIHLIIAIIDVKYYSVALSFICIVSTTYMVIRNLTNIELNIMNVLSNILLYILYLSYPLTIAIVLSLCTVCLIIVLLLVLKPDFFKLNVALELKVNEFRVQYLAIIASFASLAYALPYLTLVNRSGYFVSVDIVYYSKWINLMSKHGPFRVVLMHNDRPLFLILLYYMKSLFNVGLGAILIVTGIISTILLVLGVFLLTKTIFSNENIGLISSLLVILSHQLLAFIYGGFYANYLALSLSYIAMALIVEYFHNNSVLRGLAVLVLSSIIIALIHLWTWIHMMLIITLYFTVRLIVEKRAKDSIPKHLALALTSSIILLAIGATYTYAYALSKPVYNVIGRYSILGLSGLIRVFTYYLWGVLNNLFYYLFALLFVLDVILKRTLMNKRVILLVSMYAVTSLLLLPYLSNEVMILRLLMNTPFYIATAYYLDRINSKWFRLAVLSVLLYWNIYNIINSILS